MKVAHLIDYNPWEVSDASSFLNYCCPECIFIHDNLQEFSKHALENHILANTLFTQEKPIVKLEPLHEFTGDLVGEDTLDITPSDLEQLENAYEKKDIFESDPLSFISGKSIVTILKYGFLRSYFCKNEHLIS